VEDEHDGLTGTGRRPGARDGERTAGHWNIDVRLERLPFVELTW
jgi:hypothetical protein